MAHADRINFAPRILTVPGIDNSGPDHWQTIWDRERGDCNRVDLGLWARPQRNPWVTRLNQAISGAGGPVVLVAHSLGCLAVAWWAALESPPFGDPVAGALLVAPPDVDTAGPDLRIVGFGPAPKLLLPFPSIVVASSDDPYCDLGRAHNLAKFWGSRFVEAGALGHINAASHLGAWDEGQALLETLLGEATARGPERHIVRGLHSPQPRSIAAYAHRS